MTYTVIYRTGGTERFKWVRVLETYPTFTAARVEADQIERMGYKTLIHDTARLDAIGLPETFETTRRGDTK